MGEIRKLVSALTLRQKITILFAAIAVVTGLFAFARWKRESDFKPIYTGMAPEDAAAVVRKLRESGADFRLSENGTTVLVPSEKVAEQRLEMAGAGLGKSGRIGFELFDKPNFGATDFAEHVNFRRALEGELERSVASLAEVEQARVHLTFSKESVFLESRQPAKASVMVRLHPGSRLSQQNVTAICHLVASAVEGLTPEAVSVVDMRGNLLSRPRKLALPGGAEPSEATLDYQQKIERDLLAKIGSTLEPLVGAEKFRAGVSVECDFSSGEQSEEAFDPERSVMVTSQKTEDVSGGSGSSAGVPGTASNLPPATTPTRPATAARGLSRRTENIAFQSSRSVRRTTLPQGTVKRISVAVLVDQSVHWEGKGVQAKRVVAPPSPETMKAIRELVAGTIGLKPDRGDQLIVETLPFESTLNWEPPMESAPPVQGPFGQLPSWLQGILKNPMILAVSAGGALVLLLAAAAGVFLLLRKKRKGKMVVAMQGSLPAGDGAGKGALMSPEEVEKRLEKQLAEQDAAKQLADMEALNSLRLPVVSTKKTEALTRHLRETVKKDPHEATQVLLTWLTEGN